MTVPLPKLPLEPNNPDVEVVEVVPELVLVLLVADGVLDEVSAVVAIYGFDEVIT
jgi:hypothetical protein